MQFQQILSSFLIAKTEKELVSATNQLKTFEATATFEEKEAINATINAKAKLLLSDSEMILAEANSYLTQKGNILDLNEWLTLKNYATRFGLSNTNVVSNWIKRGLVPNENVMVVPELNNLKLIKAVKYSS